MDRADEENLQKEIKRLSSIVRVDRPLENPNFSVRKKSKICGSVVTIDANFDKNGALETIGYRTRACSLGMAATAILVQQGVGCTRQDLIEVLAHLKKLLSEETVTFSKQWQHLGLFKGVIAMKQRHSAILLPFEAVITGFDELCHTSKAL